MLYGSCKYGIYTKTFKDVLFSGYFMDSLSIPSHIPSLTENDLLKLSNLSYPDIVFHILHYFISEEEIPSSHLHDIVKKAYDRFSEHIIPLVCLQKDVYVAEMFHGPTLSFKDYSLSVIGQLLQYFSERQQNHLTLIVGTFGDTGSAAIESVKKSKWVDIISLYPKEWCSNLQELQMTTVTEKNVHCLSVERPIEDIDNAINNCFSDIEFSRKNNIGCVNSVNWARVAIQAAHFFYIYFQLCGNDIHKVIEFIIPSGGCGHLTGGLIAKLMGLPIKLFPAVNQNAGLYRIVMEGELSLERKTIHTLASAMDIQMPYNIERILHLLSCDVNSIRSWMEELKTKNVKLPSDIIDKLQNMFKVVKVDDCSIKNVMKQCWDSYKYLICPHTATALHAYFQSQNAEHSNRELGIKTVCIATASPSKFPEVLNLVSLTPPVPAALECLHLLPSKKIIIQKDDDLEKQLRDLIENLQK